MLPTPSRRLIVRRLSNALDGDRHKVRRVKFVDRVRIRAKGGEGGSGCVSLETMAPGKQRPDGGHGGRGGNVILTAKEHVHSLGFSKHHYNAGNGTNGRGKSKHGRRGQDVVLGVPCGTIVKEVVRKRGHEEVCMPVIDLDEDGMSIVVANGGDPGLGNSLLRGKFLRNSPRRLPTQKTKSKPPDIRFLELELKLIAHVGLVGYPNAGKSTFLSAVSQAKPEIADYPFTTLHPNVGHVHFHDDFNMTIADIPGLIEGAHRNVGLGHKFLRHIERTKVLLYVLDGFGRPGGCPWDELESLQQELELYAPNITSRPSLILANKADVEEADKANLVLLQQMTTLPVIAASALTGQNIPSVVNALRALVERTNSTHGHSV